MINVCWRKIRKYKKQSLKSLSSGGSHGQHLVHIPHAHKCTHANANLFFQVFHSNDVSLRKEHKNFLEGDCCVFGAPYLRKSMLTSGLIGWQYLGYIFPLFLMQRELFLLSRATQIFQLLSFGSGTPSNKVGALPKRCCVGISHYVQCVYSEVFSLKVVVSTRSHLHPVAWSACNKQHALWSREPVGVLVSEHGSVWRTLLLAH